MASIKGVTLKKVHKTTGMEGPGFLADVYIRKEKVGSYADYGDGGMGTMNYVSKEMKEKFMHIVFRYMKENPNPFKETLYAEEPERMADEMERLARCYPYIPENERCIDGDSFEFLVTDILCLMENEKAYKRQTKKDAAYSCMAVWENQYCFFNSRAGEDAVLKRIDEMTDEESGSFERLYRSLDDFNIA